MGIKDTGGCMIYYHFQAKELQDGSINVSTRAGIFIGTIKSYLEDDDMKHILALMHRAYDEGIKDGIVQTKKEIRKTLGL